jgi:Fic family protein
VTVQEIHLIFPSRLFNQTPGEFRRSQNWIGGTRTGNAAFVPPPIEAVLECMNKLELIEH